jgi:hypothetical protein
MTDYRSPRSTCQVCGGHIHDAGLFMYQNRWLHTYEEDWVNNPHNAVPDPADHKAAAAADRARYQRT